jgi:hypothetical protein
VVAFVAEHPYKLRWGDVVAGFGGFGYRYAESLSDHSQKFRREK